MIRPQPVMDRLDDLEEQVQRRGVVVWEAQALDTIVELGVVIVAVGEVPDHVVAGVVFAKKGCHCVDVVAPVFLDTFAWECHCYDAGCDVAEVHVVLAILEAMAVRGNFVSKFCFECLFGRIFE